MSVELPAFHNESDVGKLLLVDEFAHIPHQFLLAFKLDIPLRPWVSVDDVDISVILLAVRASDNVNLLVTKSH